MKKKHTMVKPEGQQEQEAARAVVHHEDQPEPDVSSPEVNHDVQPEPEISRTVVNHERPREPEGSKPVVGHEIQPGPVVSKLVVRHEGQPKPELPGGIGGDEPHPEPSRVTGLRYGLYMKKTRIVIDLDSQVSFTHKREAGNRLCIDMDNARVGSAGRKIKLMGKRVIEAEIKESSPESVRTVILVRPGTSYGIFQLKKPFRIVVDVMAPTIKAEG